MASKKPKAGHRWIGCHFLVMVQLKSPAGIVFNPGVELECYGVDHGKLHLRNPRAPVRLIRGVHPWLVREVAEQPVTLVPKTIPVLSSGEAASALAQTDPVQLITTSPLARLLAEQPLRELAEEIDKDLGYEGGP